MPSAARAVKIWGMKTETRARPAGSAALALAVVCLLLAAACGGERARGGTAAPPPATTAAMVAKSCLEAAESARLFRFRTNDGATLVGLVLGSGRTGLVLGHQLGSDLCEWVPQARSFAGRGYRVMVFDFAGFGDSQPGPDGRVDTDVAAAVAQLRRRGVDRVVLVGSSMGGTAVLSAATRIRPPVAGVVSLSGASGFGGWMPRGRWRGSGCRCCSSSAPTTSISPSRRG